MKALDARALGHSGPRKENRKKKGRKIREKKNSTSSWLKFVPTF
jgi:hypothetical protein